MDTYSDLENIKGVLYKVKQYSFEIFKLISNRFSNNGEYSKIILNKLLACNDCDKKLNWIIKNNNVDTSSFQKINQISLENFKIRIPLGNFTIYDLYNLTSYGFYDSTHEIQTEYEKCINIIFQDFDYSIIIKEDKEKQYEISNFGMLLINCVYSNINNKLKHKILDTIYSCLGDKVKYYFFNSLDRAESVKFDISNKIFDYSEKWLDYGLRIEIMNTMSDSYRYKMCEKYKKGDTKYLTLMLENMLEPRTHNTIHPYTYQDYLPKYLKLGAEVTDKLISYFMSLFETVLGETQWDFRMTEILFTSLKDVNIIGLEDSCKMKVSPQFIEYLTSNGYDKLVEVIKKEYNI